MLKFRKNRMLLLKEVRDLITGKLERSDDRRESRRLKYMRKEVDTWISELKATEVKDTHGITIPIHS